MPSSLKSSASTSKKASSSTLSLNTTIEQHQFNSKSISTSTNMLNSNKKDKSDNNKRSESKSSLFNLKDLLFTKKSNKQNSNNQINSENDNQNTLTKYEGGSSSTSSSSSASASSHGNKSHKSSITNISSTSSIVSVKHYDSLISELRCPGCAEPMAAPIKLCTSGHSVCEPCTIKLSGCPLCTEKFTETRSVTLEALSAKAQFYCCNNSRGCTVRLPLDLMKWHEKHCLYQMGHCFMGKVWGGCNWSGCEIDWLNHCVSQHSDRVWQEPIIENTWIYDGLNLKSTKPIVGYHIFRVFNETFNVYHMYDKPKSKMMWTVICASKNIAISERFAFELELYLPNDESRLLVQRLLCHNEKNEDILEEGSCAMFNMADIMRFLDGQQVLHYRIKIIDLSINKSASNLLQLTTYEAGAVDGATTTNSEQSNSQSQSVVKQSIDDDDAADDQIKHIHLGNTKNIPLDKIITKVGSSMEQRRESNKLWDEVKQIDYERNKTNDCFAMLREQYYNMKMINNSVGQLEKQQATQDLKHIFTKEFSGSQTSLSHERHETKGVYSSAVTSSNVVETTETSTTTTRNNAEENISLIETAGQQTNEKANTIPKPPRKSRPLSKTNSIELTTMLSGSDDDQSLLMVLATTQSSEALSSPATPSFASISADIPSSTLKTSIVDPAVNINNNINNKMNDNNNNSTASIDLTKNQSTDNVKVLPQS